MCETYQVEDFWISLSKQIHRDFGNRGFKNLVKINSECFIFQMVDYFCIYNTKQDEWTRLKASYMNFDDTTPIAYNSNTKQIYAAIYNKLIVVDIDTLYAQKSGPGHTENKCKDGYLSTLIFINGDLHIIGGHNYDQNDLYSHYIWNKENKSTKHIHTFTEQGIKGNFSGFGLVYAKKRGELYLLGGFDDGRVNNQWRRDEIFRYRVSAQKWSKLDLKLPRRMNNFGCVITKDERYIICCAGLNDEDDPPSYKDIIVLDLNIMKFLSVDMKFPHNRIGRAIIMDDNERNDLLTHGFIRREVMKYNVDIPFEIIELLCNWHVDEYMHVVNEEGKHWKINVDDIMQRLVDLNCDEM